MFWRWIGALTVSGRPSSVTQRATSSFFGGGAGIGADPLGVLGVDVLERDLDVIEPALGEILEAGAIERDGGGDQVRVETGLGRRRDDVLEVLPRGGLAAREMHLEDAHLAGLLHHRAPHLGGELLVDALELDRIGAIGALQGTAMRQLGEQADGRARAKRRLRVAARALGRLVVDDERLAMSVGL